MSIDIIGLLVYVIVLRFHTYYDWNIKYSATAIGIVPFIIKVVYSMVTASAYSISLAQLITPSDIVIAIGQLITTFVIFYFLQKNDEDIASWFFIGLFGAFINYSLIPYVVPMFAAY